MYADAPYLLSFALNTLQHLLSLHSSLYEAFRLSSIAAYTFTLWLGIIDIPFLRLQLFRSHRLGSSPALESASKGLSASNFFIWQLEAVLKMLQSL